MSDRSEALREMADYAAAVAGVGESAARDRGVSAVRVERMKDFFSMARKWDPDAFYVVVNEYATGGAQAVATCLAARAESEFEKALQTEPTPTVQTTTDVLDALKGEP